MLDSLGGITAPSVFSFDTRSDTTPLSGLSSNHSSLTSGSPPSNTWLFPSQSVYSSLGAQLHSTTSDADSQISLSDQVSPFCLSDTVESLPLSITDLTGVPLKQMPQAAQARLGGVAVATARRGMTYAVASPGAPGTPIALPQNTSTNVPPPKNPKLYKTELCRSWMDQGRCNYGERCQYAHGEHEKRSVPRHPKYKTEMCQSYHKSGYCPYGARCHFIHNESEAYQSRESSLRAAGLSPLSPALAALPMAPPTHLSGQALAPGAPLLSRLSSLPGYGSAGESPAGSSADSGSESPAGSFSPGLDLDETALSPLAAVFGLTAASLSRTLSTHSSCTASRFVPGQGGFTDNFPSSDGSHLGPLLEDIVAWTVDEKADAPGRLPVFAQLSNPPQ